MTEFTYIMSASHSGSTLLTLLLAAHPEIATIGETSAVTANGSGDTGLCSCGVKLRQCSFWEQVCNRMAARGVDARAADFSTEFRIPKSRSADRLLRAEYRGRSFETLRDLLLSCSPAWRARGKTILATNVALVESVREVCGARVFLDSSKEPHRLKFLLRAPSLSVKVIHLVRDGRGVAASYRRKGMSMPQAVDGRVI